MDMTKLTTILSLLIALSIASERLVEIIKGWVPWLNCEDPNPTKEGRRRAVLQLMAVAAGIVTAYFASGLIPSDVYDATTSSGVLALGLLASGGSGFWNSLLTYVTKVKEVKSADATLRKVTLDQVKTQTDPDAHPDLRLGEEQVTSNECYDVQEA